MKRGGSTESHGSIGGPTFGLALLLCILLLLAKAPDSIVNPQFWAEDAAVFFAGQYNASLPPLFAPYAGYLHLLPRLTAWFATCLPVADAPFVYSVLALAIGGAALSSLRGLRVVDLRFSIVLLVLALTPTNGEIFGTITNVQWLTQFYFVSMLARLFTGQSEHASRSSVVCAGVLGLTGPLAIFVVPAAIAGTIFLRWRTGGWARLRELTIAGITPEWVVLTACAGLQLWLIAGSPHVGVDTRVAAGSFVLFAASLQTHVFGAPLLPTWLFLLLVAVLPWLAARRRGEICLAFVVALTTDCCLQLAATATRFADSPGAMLALENGDRYFFLFKITFWWFVALALSPRAQKSGKLAWIYLLAMLAAVAFRSPTTLYRKPLLDLKWRDYAARIDAGEDVDIPVNPPPWHIRLHARQVDLSR